MPCYRPAGQDFYLPNPIPELEPFKGKNEAGMEVQKWDGNHPTYFITHTTGWVAGTQRTVEVYGSEIGFLLKVEECGEYLIAPRGEAIGRPDWQCDSRQMDREILLGPVIVLALALKNVWSLHASAAMYNENIIAFLGESGMGKSTLAAYLSKRTGWQLVADDILPVKDENGLRVLPRFPQLKLPMDAQPGVDLPEHLPLKYLCVLEHAKLESMPDMKKMTPAQTVQAFLSHIAGARMFNAELLAKHLCFSAQAAAQVTAFKLTYPRRREALPGIKELLENLC
jgi:hypothetical protein